MLAGPDWRMPARRALIVAAASAALTACAARVDTRGNLAEAEKIEEIKPGVSTREEVMQILGSPSSVAAFNGSTWYYIGNKTETVAFFKPSVVEQQVLAVTFDEDGRVAEVNRLGLADAQKVEISERVSPTRGKEPTLFQQMYRALLRGRGDYGANEGFTK